jgi:asparagine synthase (glutamine-hydrolysing)
LGLRERWTQYRQQPDAPDHPLRPIGYASFHTALWQAYFGDCDSGATGSPCEFRHPFMDLRMLKFMLAIPPLPWCRTKFVLRRAMRNILPEPVLRRKKSAVRADPVVDKFESVGWAPLIPAEGFGDYVDVRRVHAVPNRFMNDIGNLLCARSLNHWLHCSLRIRHNVPREEDLNG